MHTFCLGQASQLRESSETMGMYFGWSSTARQQPLGSNYLLKSASGCTDGNHCLCGRDSAVQHMYFITLGKPVSCPHQVNVTVSLRPHAPDLRLFQAQASLRLCLLGNSLGFSPTPRLLSCTDSGSNAPAFPLPSELLKVVRSLLDGFATEPPTAASGTGQTMELRGVHTVTNITIVHHSVRCHVMQSQTVQPFECINLSMAQGLVGLHNSLSARKVYISATAD